MRKVLLLILVTLVFVACKDKDPSPNNNAKALISLNQWQLVRYTDTSGQLIQNSDLDNQALFLYAMNFEFRAGGEVRGIDKASKNIIEKGVWNFVDEDTSVVNVKLASLDYNFRIVEIKTGKLTLQAPTGNFLSGIGDEINLEFTAVSL